MRLRSCCCEIVLSDDGMAGCGDRRSKEHLGGLLPSGTTRLDCAPTKNAPRLRQDMPRGQMIELTNRVVVVTGAGNGMGRSHALEFARPGALVVMNDYGCIVDGTGSSISVADAVVDAPSLCCALVTRQINNCRRSEWHLLKGMPIERVPRVAMQSHNIFRQQIGPRGQERSVQNG